MVKTAAWKQQRLSAQRERRRLGQLRRRRDRTGGRLAGWRQLAEVAPAQPHHDPKVAARRSIRVITPPPHLDLDENYEVTIKLLKDVRFATQKLRGDVMVEMKAVQDISPAAALLLVAECDRWRERTKAQWLRAHDVNGWVASVRRRLKEMGFFEVLNSRNIPDDEFTPGEDRYVPFLTGKRTPGPPAAELRHRIEALGPTVADRESLFEGLVEAMTNVAQHAYSGPSHSSGPERWWISASVNAARNTMTVMVVDHGVGIARTLPRSAGWETIRQYIPFDGVKDDAELVRAAFAKGGVNKSQTGEDHRGKGLRENIKGYVESHDSRGQLRVITNRAMYTYSRHNNIESETSVSVPIPFDGTFIEWVIEDYGQE